MDHTDLRCVTWNVHRAKGNDGIVDPGRITHAIDSEVMAFAPHVLALQEADEECRPHARILDVHHIEAQTGLRYLHRSDKLRWGTKSDGFLGTILFLHPRHQVTHEDVLDLPGDCHRGAVCIETRQPGTELRIISCHLSLAQPLRIAQMRIIGQYLYRRPQMPTLLLGDFNEWRPWGGLMFHKRLLGRQFRGPVRATFPARFPVLPLDRIMTDTPNFHIQAHVLRSPLLKMASDHLPLAATITNTGGPE